MGKIWKIAIIGECMIELYRVQDRFVQTYGGDTFNTAAYISRICGSDAKVEYMSAVGENDSFSKGMLRFWQDNGVGSELTQRIKDRLPGLYAIEVDENGERNFQYWRNEAAVKECFQTDGGKKMLKRLQDYDLVYFSGISLAVLRPESRENLLLQLEKLAAAGRDIAFDFNYRPKLWDNDPAKSAPHYRRAAALCRWIFLSPEEAVAAGFAPADVNSPRFYADIASLGAKEAIIKNGEKPCVILDCHSGEKTVVEVEEKLHPLDTTAAGDSFTAAYLAGAHYGLSPRESARRAQKLAGAVIMHPGAIIDREATPRIFADCQ